MIKESFQEKDTFEFARQLGEQASPGEIYCLEGDLGTGKTVFAKGFAAGLGIREPVTSPTFNIVKEYEEETKGRAVLFLDLKDGKDKTDIGYEDYFFGQGVCLVEWSSLIRELIPEGAVQILLEKDPEKGFDYRRITVTGTKEVKA